MSLPGYPSYKDTGVEWIGSVPQHWDVTLARRFFIVKSGDMISKDEETDEGVPIIGGNGLRGYTTKFNTPGDTLIIGRVGALCGCAHHIREDFWASEHAFRVLPRQEFDRRFFFFLLTALDLNRFAIKTAQPLLNSELVETQFISAPPLPEQKSIAAFLDRETGKIDGLVNEQRRLIELLKEKRQAVISHAVTQGLNPNAPMKPSGIEWLGDVPEHWEVTPLLRLTAPGRDVMYGIVLPGPNVEKGVPIVKGGDVKGHRLRLDLLNRTTHEIEAPFARARLRPDDIVYSIRGTIGDAELVPGELEDANITQDVARVSPRSDVNAVWLLHALRSRPVFVQLEQRSLGAAVRGINIYDLKRARIPTPPEEEQAQIAEFLEEGLSRLNGLIAEAERAISLLQERRSALISAAVTGKIDVRGIVPLETEAA